MNQLKAGVLLSYLNIFIGSVVGIAYTPIMLRLLGQSEYGLYSLCTSMIGCLSLFNFGFSSAYIRYYSLFKAEGNLLKIKQLNGMFLLVFIAIAVLVAVSGSIIILNLQDILGNKFTEQELEIAKVLMIIMTFNLALTMPSSVFSSFIAAREKFVFQKGIEVLRIICNPIITLPLLLMGYRSIAVVLVASLLTIISFIINTWFCINSLKVEFNFGSIKLNLLKEIFWFSFFIFLQIVMDKMNWEINKFIIGRYCGSIAVAVYSIGAQLNFFFIQFATAISNVFIPRVNKLVAENHGNNSISLLFAKVARIQFIIVFCVFSGFVFFGNSFILLWTGVGYENSYIVALLLMSPMVLELTQCLGIEILRARNLHRIINVIYIGICIVNIIITIPLSQQYNEIGGAMGTCITMFVGKLIITNYYYHFVAKIDMKLYFREIIKLMPASILPCIFGGFILVKTQITTVGSFIIYIAIYILLYGFSYWQFGMNQDEKDIIYSIMNRFIKPKKNILDK